MIVRISDLWDFGILCGILMPVFFMTFLDQFGDGISIAVGFPSTGTSSF